MNLKWFLGYFEQKKNLLGEAEKLWNSTEFRPPPPLIGPLFLGHPKETLLQILSSFQEELFRWPFAAQDQAN